MLGAATPNIIIAHNHIFNKQFFPAISRKGLGQRKGGS